ncbi:SAP30-binding protein-like isoform X2 [Carassius auratus]|uniref:SAP30-binding protein-like isoform X2 n=1 Tax=Carassius auratus TaxID=7957 RepID=A0A6P6K4P0_CARAU|nr:SAP30-binding protein-like isoform X2 [Carassius auratus]XP_026103237.1 SAP30-binding protein-like isoform X2 [Carassius auratus]XP_052460721.1 SAP30-binding protein-like isoform X2 [Carassius gibelio]
MASRKRNALLSSLAAYGDDSEQDSDPDTDDQDSHGGLVSASYGEDDVSRVEEADEKPSENEDSDDDSTRNSEEEESDSERTQDDVKDVTEVEVKDPNELVAQFSEKVRNMSPDEIKIPPEPPGRCSSHLQEKIFKLYERKLHGDFDTNSHIQKKKEFRNPSIYEKLIQFCGIDELGTNYPKDMFDPHGWSEDSYYEALAKAQKVEMDKLEKAKKEKTKIEFVTCTKKGSTTNAAAMATNTTSTDAQKRKSKWDSAVPVTLAQPALLTTTATLPGVVSVTTTASGTKTTVISAVGTILKKAKQ